MYLYIYIYNYISKYLCILYYINITNEEGFGCGETPIRWCTDTTSHTHATRAGYMCTRWDGWRVSIDGGVGERERYIEGERARGVIDRERHYVRRYL